jgi:trimeric autotransporter adhesin
MPNAQLAYSIRDVVRDVPIDDLNPVGDIVSIALTPASPAFSTTQQMVATATYEDGSTRVITTQSGIVWASSDVAKATISAAGLATKVAAGSPVLSATYGGKTGSTTATVT